MRQDRPSGLLVPLTTPFDPTTGDVAPVDLRENARVILEAGANGLVAAGSTGEASLLSEEEFRQVVAWLRDVAPGDRWLIAGTGRESTRATVAACHAAAEEGADAVLVRTPAYYAPVFTTQGLIDHFLHVADACPVPVLLYNFPKLTHTPITEAVAAALATHENIWGIKDSTGDLKNFGMYHEVAPGWALFMGTAEKYYAALEMDAAGAIAAAGNYAAASIVAIGTAFGAGDRAGAGAVQEVVAPLHREIVAKRGVPGIKAAMDLVGLAGGPVRPPLTDLDTRERDRLAGLLQEAHLTAR
jgi:4-hydroxy-2-oxoglutarate aldolase